ncbi:hypothetical protein K501DRAFT_328434 [Backusella circina FSU 941]|nr:hypothetical protein K501DRAFT_328434 [Backusella circina FSU 941]
MTLANLVDLDIVIPKKWPNIGIYKVGLHILQALFSFLGFCVLTTVISAEKTYLGASQAAPNYDLVVAILSLLISLVLIFSPMSQYQLECFQGIKNFFLKVRTDLVLNCFFTLAWFVAMVSMTVHSTHPESCILDSSLIKEDSNYASSWGAQCNCGKAAAAFSWLLFFFWAGSTVCSTILFANEIQLKNNKHNEPTDNEKDSVIPEGYDADAQSIKNMTYSEKEKQPIALYNNDSAATVVDPNTNEYERSMYQHTASASPIINGENFASPYLGSRPYEYTAASPPCPPSDRLSSPPHVPRHINDNSYGSNMVSSPHYHQPEIPYQQSAPAQPTYMQNPGSPYITQVYTQPYVPNNNVRNSFIPAYNSPNIAYQTHSAPPPPTSYDPQYYSHYQ